MTYSIAFPRECTPGALAHFSLEIDRISEADEFRINTRPVRFFTPTAMVFLAKSCRQRARKYPNENVMVFGLKNHAYANNLGFSDALNLRGRPFPQGAFGGGTYIPISIMTRRALVERAGILEKEVGDAIQERCEDIAQIVSQGKSDSLRAVVARSFCEIFRNTFEHGEADSAVFCAQYWPQKETVEICIADRGIGIETSLLESKYTNPKNNREALFYSLMPGVSSKAWRHKKKKSHQKTVWDNAGYGLFFAHQLFGGLGHFFLASKGNALLIEGGELTELKCNIEGTLVSMSIDLSNEAKLEAYIETISKLAHKVKEKIGVKSVSFGSVEGFLKTGVF